MPKFFVEHNQKVEQIINIVGEDVNHIKNVLRDKVGNKLDITVKGDKTYLCEITQIEKDKIECKIIKEIIDTTEPNTYINILQGLPKADKMELIIQKNTEIGVKEITPIIMKRCVVKLDKKSQESKITRWQKIAEVAAKQSGRDYIPHINNCIDLKNISKIVEDYDIILVAYENEKIHTLKEELKHLNKNTNKIAIVIGPEGGLDIEEIDYLESIGAKAVTLGKRILRTETAGLVICSNILYELEE